LGGIKAGPDPDPKFTASLRQLLQDIGDSKPSDMLTASYAPRISADFRKQITANLPDVKSFSFLSAEAIGEDHFVLDPTLVKAVHYKLVSGDRTVYYTFRLDKYGKVGFIVVTEE